MNIHRQYGFSAPSETQSYHSPPRVTQEWPHYPLTSIMLQLLTKTSISRRLYWIYQVPRIEASRLQVILPSLAVV